MKLIQRFLALVCLVLLFIFCISNREVMPVRFLSWESIELPVFLLLVFAFLTGAVLALLWQSLRGVSPAQEKTPRKAKKTEHKQPDADGVGSNPVGETGGGAEADVTAPVAQKHEGEN